MIDGAAKPRLSVFVSHPTPFEGPLYPKIVQKCNLELSVYFWRVNPLAPYVGEGGIRPQWDIQPLTDGYSYYAVPSRLSERWRFIVDQALRPFDQRVVLINGWSTQVSLLALLAAWRRRVPIILRLDTVDLYPTSAFMSFGRRLWRSFLYHIPVAFMATSSLTRLHLRRRGIRDDRIFMFPYAVDNDLITKLADSYRAHRSELRHALGIDPGAKVVMAAVKFVPREGAQDLVRVFAMLKDWSDSTVLLLVGDGPMRPWLEEFVRQKEKMKVVFTGWVAYSRLIQLFSVSDLFLHPGIHEPWGCSIQEAAVCRLPILSSSLVGASYDLVQPGVNGLVYDGGNVEGLRSSLIAMLEQCERWVAMGERSWLIAQGWGHDKCITELDCAVNYAMSHRKR